MQSFDFYKMCGSGNDFIIVDNRDLVIDHSNLPRIIKGACRRQLSAGADGFILVENCESADFKWHFFNSDGSRAEMCGNGARCAARFAYLNQIADKRMSFETDAGIVHAAIIDDRVKVNMPDPTGLKLDYPIMLKNGQQSISSINTGVPHAVIETDDVTNAPVFDIGREIRYHAQFTPAGTNVNFITQLSQQSIQIRTYERGVEDETLACGTGSIGAALIVAKKYNRPSPIKVKTQSGQYLTIHFELINDRFCHVFLEGDARVIYKGTLFEEALD